MPRSALQTVLHLRRIALNQSRRDLAECLIAEAAAEHLALEAEAAIARETEAATAIDAGDGVVESFALWLRQARGTAMSSQQAWDHACAETTRARAGLAAARAATEAAEELIAQQEALVQAQETRAAQVEIDETARRVAKR